MWFEWRTVVAIIAIPAILGLLIQSLISIEEPANQQTEGDPDSEIADLARMDSFSDFFGNAKLLFGLGFSAVFVVVLSQGIYYR